MLRSRLNGLLSRKPKYRFKSNWTFSEVMSKFQDENDRYEYFAWYFRNHLSSELAAHRRFFAYPRGFGESAFHAMWEKLLIEFIPTSLLEIGVYRGQTISLWHLILAKNDAEPEIWGVSPLSSVGDTVSTYADIDYERDILSSFSTLGLAKPKIFRGKSQDSKAVLFMRSRTWDLVYIDGSHDFDDVVFDVSLASEILSPNGILVMDDASLNTAYRAGAAAFAGHPGPSRVGSILRDGQESQEIGTCGHNRVFRKVIGQ